jgi:hypothetical protein
MVMRKTFCLFESRGVPVARVDAGDGAGGHGQFTPSEAPELVPVPSIPDEFQKQETVGPAEGGGT